MVVLPQFPLGSVLFPTMVLPLHVFEPRYRALIHDVADLAELQRCVVEDLERSPVLTDEIVDLAEQHFALRLAGHVVAFAKQCEGARDQASALRRSTEAGSVSVLCPPDRPISTLASTSVTPDASIIKGKGAWSFWR